MKRQTFFTLASPLFLSTALLGASLPAVAGQDHEHSSHDAHTHGLAELTLAMEDNLLEVHLSSPAANLVGFEHKANDEEQQQLVANAEKLLLGVQGLFAFEGTNCTLNKAEVDLSAVSNTELAQHDEHNEEHHEHHDEHEQHDDHHEHNHKNTHSDINANYQFNCDDGEELQSMQLLLLEKFKGIEKLKVLWITEAGQGSMTATQNSPIVKLR